MTNEEINKLIHEQIMGECWHEFEPYRAIHGNDSCLRGCGFDRFGGPHPNYCTNLNAVARAEAKVIEDMGSEGLYDELESVMWSEGTRWEFPFAPAVYRAEACLRVMDLWRDDD